jgi:predicted nucleic acid-binding protein
VRAALDTNILVYAEGLNGPARRADAIGVLTQYAEDELLIPVQALGELFVVLTRKAAVDPHAARAAVLAWRDSYGLIETGESVVVDAMELAASHRFSLWDAVILAGAAAAACRILITEDMQDGFTWRGVTVRAPWTTA